MTSNINKIKKVDSNKLDLFDQLNQPSKIILYISHKDDRYETYWKLINDFKLYPIIISSILDNISFLLLEGIRLKSREDLLNYIRQNFPILNGKLNNFDLILIDKEIIPEEYND